MSEPRCKCGHERYRHSAEVTDCYACGCMAFEAARVTAPETPRPPLDPLGLALLFHSEYEALAPQFGYETRTETRAFDAASANGRLMVAVCQRIIEHISRAAPASLPAEAPRADRPMRDLTNEEKAALRRGLPGEPSPASATEREALDPMHGFKEERELEVMLARLSEAAILFQQDDTDESDTRAQDAYYEAEMALLAREAALHKGWEDAETRCAMAEAREAELRWEIARIVADLKPLHALAQELDPVGAWGENVCEWAADKIKAESERAEKAERERDGAMQYMREAQDRIAAAFARENAAQKRYEKECAGSMSRIEANVRAVHERDAAREEAATSLRIVSEQCEMLADLHGKLDAAREEVNRIQQENADLRSQLAIDFTSNVALRILARSTVDDESGCWLMFGVNKNDYAKVRATNKMRMAHRITYEFCRGPIPRGLVIDHLCRRRNCVNPWHMEPVTNHENILRGLSVMSPKARKTHCVHGHSLEGDNLRLSKDGYRHCRACDRARYPKVRAALQQTPNPGA